LKKGNNSLAASIPTLPGGALKGGGKKLQMQGLRILRNEAYLPVRRNDER